MARVEEYRTQIEHIITQYGAYQPINDDSERQIIFDAEHDHYLLMTVGWHEKKRTYGCLLHVDIKDGKIWIQQDGTEDGIANKLVESGVPKQDIVLAFHAPYKWKYTGFGTAL